MKILQINSVCDRGSTGRTTRELADVLLNEGHECYVAYGQGTSTYPFSFKIGGKYENHFHNLFYTRILGLHGYGTHCGTKRLIKWIEQNRPDIIHLRNLHANYLNYPMLFRCIIKNKIPVVFTLHDCFNFTGKCSHYTAKGCYKWQKECYNCPLIHTTAPSWFFDHSRKIFREKKSFYSNIPKMTVVAVSKWLMHEAEQSILAGNGHRITYIYNWIDYNKFHRSSDEQISLFYKKYKLSPEKKYLISVSQGWDKNSSRFRDAQALAKALPDNYKLILIGGTARGTEIPAPILHIPYIEGNEELSTAYSMADSYVHLSVEDTFGKVIAEAMCCGTVPITFDSTACGEIPGPYGIVVAPHDIDAIVKSLSHLDELKENKDEMLQYVRDNYDYHTNAAKYIDLYKELLINK
ncbi:MAG: glycosyltransferase [Bacteroidaceae bacterium]|nr:glycosyltransferase [Bacteroidaceae bacterium]